MDSGNGTDWAVWAEKAAMRLAECEAAVRRLGERDSPRRAKLARRSARYAELAALFGERAGAARRGSAPATEEDRTRAVEEVDRLKERIWGAATTLASDRTRLNELRVLLGRDGANGVDFDFEAPPEDATRRLRAAHEIIRSLGL